MTDRHDDEARQTDETRPADTACRKPISMHEGVPHWHDVCCCEAEPRWVALAEELGIDLDAGWERNGS
ncbi:MAG: hypothetical protein LOY58_00110 [Gammaproteobacteria bacterium]|nr:hypothetical protein [Gammaproteobacteria bacterium]